MRLIESLLANLNRELRLAKYIESAQLYLSPLKVFHFYLGKFGIDFPIVMLSYLLAY